MRGTGFIGGKGRVYPRFFETEIDAGTRAKRGTPAGQADGFSNGKYHLLPA